MLANKICSVRDCNRTVRCVGLCRKHYEKKLTHGDPNAPDKRVKHGMARRASKNRMYAIWNSMRSRCNCVSNQDYKYYGGRGISVCARWNDYAMFLQDMGEAPIGKSIDRIDNDGNYEPGNCRWATQKQQVCNSPRTRLITCDGKTMPLMDWDKSMGFSHGTVRCRILRGWSIERAIHTPARVCRRSGGLT